MKWNRLLFLEVSMKHIGFSFCLPIALLLVGCQKDPRTTELERKLDDASTQISLLQNKLDEVNGALAEIKRDREVENLFKDFDKFAYLTPGSEGYSIIRFDLGVVTVKLADIKPYANGSKVTLEFGNPLSATVTGLKATLDWGRGPCSSFKKTAMRVVIDASVLVLEHGSSVAKTRYSLLLQQLGRHPFF